MNKKPTFSTRPYVVSHMKEPKGRGSWAFATDSNGTENLVFSPSMTYGEAKKWVAAQHPGVSYWYVQP